MGKSALVPAVMDIAGHAVGLEAQAFIMTELAIRACFQRGAVIGRCHTLALIGALPLPTASRNRKTIDHPRLVRGRADLAGKGAGGAIGGTPASSFVYRFADDPSSVSLDSARHVAEP